MRSMTPFVFGLAILAGFSAAAEEANLDQAWRRLFQRDLPTAQATSGTQASVALGARLFADKRLSGAGNRSCATCHQAERGYSDGRRRALSLSNVPLQRNTPTLWNLAWGKRYFWDGRAASLEEQISQPIENAAEMAGDWPTVLRRLSADADMVAAFRAAYPGEASTLSKDTTVRALADYVRSLVSPRTRFDAWVDGDEAALREDELKGFRVFTGRGGCVLCHVGWRFTDERFHDIGLPSDDPGQGAVPGGTKGLRAFKTPTLRELAHSAPYMHDGSLPTLTSVLQHYSERLTKRASLSPHIKRDLRLTQEEIANLTAFLLTLSSDKTVARPRDGERAPANPR